MNIKDLKPTELVKRYQNIRATQRVNRVVSELTALKERSGEIKELSKVFNEYFNAGIPETFLEKAPATFTPQAALSFPPVFQLIKRISESIAALPMHVYEINLLNGNEEQLDPLMDDEAYVLTRKWSEEMSAEDGVIHFIRSVVLNGVGAALFERGSSNDIESVRCIDPTSINRLVVGNNIQYLLKVSETSPKRQVDRNEIAFLPFYPPHDGHSDISPWQHIWPSIRAGLAAELFTAFYFQNGAIASIIWTIAEDYESEGSFEKNLQAIWNLEDQMRRNNRRSMPAPAGWQANTTGGNPREAELDEQKMYAALNAARAMNLPPMAVNDHTRSTFTNSDQSERAEAKVVAALANRFAREFSIRAWPDGNREVRFDTSNMVQEPYSTRVAAYAVAHELGIKSRNDIRILEGEDPIDLPHMNEYAGSVPDDEGDGGDENE